MRLRYILGSHWIFSCLTVKISARKSLLNCLRRLTLLFPYLLSELMDTCVLKLDYSDLNTSLGSLFSVIFFLNNPSRFLNLFYIYTLRSQYFQIWFSGHFKYCAVYKDCFGDSSKVDSSSRSLRKQFWSK